MLSLEVWLIRTYLKDHVLNQLKSWCVFTGCALHDLTNAADWGMAASVASPTMLDDIFICIQSLRNGYKLLQCHILQWLSEHVKFVSVSAVEQQELQLLYGALDLPASLVDDLAERGVIYSGRELLVSDAFRESPDIFGFLYSAILSAWRFQKFTKGRWLSIGTSMRSLIASCLLGLRGIYKLTVDDPRVSLFNLSGFGRVSSQILRFAAIASVACRPVESAIVALMEDDRALMQSASLKAGCVEELGWIQSLPLGVWTKLAAVVGPGCSARELRSDALEAADVSMAYADKKFFRELGGMPWALAQGNISENLDKLATEARAPDDETAKKIWSLVKAGTNRVELVEAVQMLLQVRWSTSIVEQLHGTCASIHKLHKEMGEEQITSRTMVTFMRPLLSESPVVAIDRKYQEQLASLERRAPEKASGRSFFLGKAVEIAASHLPGKHMGKSNSQVIFANAGKHYKALGKQDKLVYQEEATQVNAEKRKQLEDDKSHVVSAWHLKRARLAEAAKVEGVPSKLDSCRLVADQTDALERHGSIGHIL